MIDRLFLLVFSSDDIPSSLPAWKTKRSSSSMSTERAKLFESFWNLMLRELAERKELQVQYRDREIGSVVNSIVWRFRAEHFNEAGVVSNAKGLRMAQPISQFDEGE